jgi:hypothetical protein
MPAKSDTRREFLGILITYNITNKKDRALQQKALKKYLKGAQVFYYGPPDPVDSMGQIRTPEPFEKKLYFVQQRRVPFYMVKRGDCSKK